MNIKLNRNRACDRCGENVELKDDSAFIESCIPGIPSWIVWGKKFRHIRCSPSRAQYVVHRDFIPVVDEREEYDKRTLHKRVHDAVAAIAANERLWTEGWIAAQHKAGDMELESATLELLDSADEPPLEPIEIYEQMASEGECDDHESCDCEICDYYKRLDHKE